MTAKEKYKQHCIENKNIPLFLTYDWLHTICNENSWNVVLKEAGNTIQGFIVYIIKSKLGQSYISLPNFTPYSGVWINYPENQKQATKISYERKVMEALIKELPKVDLCVFHLHPSITNWQPFYWLDFKQTTRYTYIINEPDIDKTHAGLRENIRREIKKAEKNLQLVICNQLNEIEELSNCVIGNTKQKLSAYLDELSKIEAVFNKNSLILKIIKDNQIVAASYFITDNQSMYYLLGVVNPNYKNSGALSLLIWEGIKQATQQKLAFNFEGSMLKNIERFFSSFGANQVPYHRITKSNSIIAKTKELIADI